jgi:hypothetical protein
MTPEHRYRIKMTWAEREFTGTYLCREWRDGRERFEFLQDLASGEQGLRRYWRDEVETEEEITDETLGD